eukprot:m.102296 g.102296  ORF g.102296 m.102296 type:complete len:64 (-) comp51536_c0_seq3:799-990(-)
MRCTSFGGAEEMNSQTIPAPASPAFFTAIRIRWFAKRGASQWTTLVCERGSSSNPSVGSCFMP